MSTTPAHVSLIAIPDAVISTLGGMYDVLSSFPAVAAIDTSVPEQSPFQVDIVGEGRGPVTLADGLPVATHRTIDQVAATDIVIVPSVLVTGARWEPGRYPTLVEWLKTMHDRGATLCSACSGVFLLAETGLLDGIESTVHWAYAETFRRSFPSVPVSPERVLVAAGEHRQFVSCGASTSWHDLVLYLIAGRAGPEAALAMARFYALQWHREGLGPYMVFLPRRDHGDALVLDAQDWLAAHYSTPNPVQAIVTRAGLAERTFKRRFSKATGLPPIAYVQRVRIEEAKRRLERSQTSVDDICWKVGYEDPAFFRRLFKRITGMPPGAYRRKFKLTHLTEKGTR